MGEPCKRNNQDNHDPKTITKINPHWFLKALITRHNVSALDWDNSVLMKIKNITKNKYLIILMYGYIEVVTNIYL